MDEINAIDIFVQEIMDQLIENYNRQLKHKTKYETMLDQKSVVTVYSPQEQCTWYFSEYDPINLRLFGVCNQVSKGVTLSSMSMFYLFSIQKEEGFWIKYGHGAERNKTILQLFDELKFKYHNALD